MVTHQLLCERFPVKILLNSLLFQHGPKFKISLISRSVFVYEKINSPFFISFSFVYTINFSTASVEPLSASTSLTANARPLVQANLPANNLGNSLTNKGSRRPLVQANLPRVQANLPSTNLLGGSLNGQANARPLVQVNLPTNNLLGNLENGLTGGRPLGQINLADSLNGGRPLVTANIPSLSVPNVNRLLG